MTARTEAKAVRAKSRLVDRSIIVVEAIVGVAVVSAIVGRTYGFSSTLVFMLVAVAIAFTGFVTLRMISSLGDPTLEVTGRVVNEARAALEHEKLLLLQGIKELEGDAGVGKVDKDDYDHLRRSAEARAIEIIHHLKEEDALFLEKAEALVAKKLGRATRHTEGPTRMVETEEAYLRQGPEERRRRPAFSGLFDDRPIEMAEREARLVCGACSTASDVDAVFCTGCGRPRKTEAPLEPPRAEGTA